MIIQQVVKDREAKEREISKGIILTLHDEKRKLYEIKIKGR